MKRIQIAGWLLGLATPAWAAELSKEAREMVERIERIAASESGLYAIDTRVRLARAIEGRLPDKADALVSESLASLYGIRDPDAMGEAAVRVVELFLDDDFEQAHRIALSIPSQKESGAKHDYKAEAFDKLVRRRWKADRPQALKLLHEGAASGAFLLESASEAVRTLSKEDPAEARAVFARMLSAFDQASEKNVFYLMRCAREIFPADRALAEAAVERIFAAVDRPDFGSEESYDITLTVRVNGREVVARNTREAVLLQVAAYLREQSPPLYERYRSRFEPWRDALETAAAKGETSYGVRFKKQQKKSPEDEIEALISRAENAENAAVRLSAAREALAKAGELDASSRLIGIFEDLASAFRSLDRKPEAADAAVSMARAAWRYCLRDAPSGGRADCLDLYDDTVQALEENGVKSGSLDLGDPSIEARLLVKQLPELLR